MSKHLASDGPEQDRPVVMLNHKTAANRANARASTVPRPDQRERALHGLIALSEEVEALVREIGGVDADVEMQTRVQFGQASGTAADDADGVDANAVRCFGRLRLL